MLVLFLLLIGLAVHDYTKSTMLSTKELKGKSSKRLQQSLHVKVSVYVSTIRKRKSVKGRSLQTKLHFSLIQHCKTLTAECILK